MNVMLTAVTASAMCLPVMTAACAKGGAPDSDGRDGSPAAADFQEFKSPSKGYSIDYPESWDVRPNAVTLGGNAYDGFSAREKDGGVVTNVIVGCAPIESGTSTEEFINDTFEMQRSQGVEPPKSAGSVSAVGSETSILVSTMAFEGHTVDLASVLFAHQNCGWEISLTTAKGLREKYQDVLVKMASSFQPNN